MKFNTGLHQDQCEQSVMNSKYLVINHYSVSTLLQSLMKLNSTFSIFSTQIKSSSNYIIYYYIQVLMFKIELFRLINKIKQKI